MTTGSGQHGRLLDEGMRGKLCSLRRALRIRLAAEGAAWLTLGLVAAIFATLGVDYLMRLDDRAPRAIVVAGALSGVAWAGWRALAAPLLVRLRLDDLALLVERKYPALGDRLIGALQFDDPSPQTADGVSAAMVHRMAAEGAAMAAGLDFKAVVERKRLWRVVRLACCAVALLLGFAIWRSDLLGVWFQRTVLMADVAWPQETYLQVDGGPDFTVLRGEDLKVAYSARGKAPGGISLFRVYASLGRPDESRIDAGPNKPGRYETVFRAVQEDFEFYATGGDDVADSRRPHRVRVILPPSLGEATMVVQYPAYVDEVRRFDMLRETATVPFGGRVRIEARARKKLRQAEVLLDDVRVWPRPDAPTSALESASFTAEFEMPIMPAANAPASRILKFVLVDDDGYSNRGGQAFTIQILADEPPNVEFAKAGGLADMHVITAKATVPFRVTARDEYGVGVQHLTRQPNAATLPTTGSSGASSRAASAPVAGEARIPAIDLIIGDGKGEMFRQPAQALIHNGSLRSVEIKCTLSLDNRVQEGQSVLVRAEACDGRTARYGGPGRGVSGPIEFSVVSPAAMSDELQRRQKSLCERFTESVNDQAAAYAKTAAAATELAGRGETDEASAGAQVGVALAESARMQRQVADQCAETKAVLQAIFEEMQYNHLGQQEELTAMSVGIIDPLGGLAERGGRVAGELNALTAGGADGAKLHSRLDDLASQQQSMLDEMKAVLRRMEKLRSLQAMADRVERMVRWLKDLQDEIERQRQAQIENLLDSTSRPAPR